MKIAFTLILVFSTIFGKAQVKNTISGEYKKISLEHVILDFENQTPYKFYYEAQWLDSIFITASFKDETLKKALEMVLSNTKLNHFFHHNKIILTNNTIIKDSLVKGFFGDSIPEENNQIKTEYLFPREYAPVYEEIVSIENKVIEIGKKTDILTSGSSTIAGYLKNKNNGEPLAGAVVYSEKANINSITDQFGFYSLTLPNGRNVIKYQIVGMKSTKRTIMLFSSGKLDVEMFEEIIALKEVTIESERDRNISGMQMGLNKIDIQTMKNVPRLLGENDVMRIAITLPGVQTVGEGATGFNVRGGKTDQNLMLLNDAPIYNPSHFFGFFSVFNADVIKEMELYKSGIPAEHGGRLSSIFDVKMRDGNQKKFSAQGGIGPVSTRLTLEGPILKDKSSIIIGGRTTYSDWVLDLVPESSLKNSSASFYDLVGKISHTINENNLVQISGYYSKDKFSLSSDSVFQYSNKLASAQWRHNYNNQFNSVLSGTISEYNYNLDYDGNSEFASSFGFDINEKTLKMDFNYFPGNQHLINFGGSSKYYLLHPGYQHPLGENSLIINEVIDPEAGLENALYFSDNIEISSRLSVYLGLRYSTFTALGPGVANEYSSEGPRETGTIISSTQYEKNEPIETYHGPEYRFSTRYAFSPATSLKFSYNRTRQYIHMLSNTTAISPLDTWKLSDANILPQIGDQWSLGLYKNLRNGNIETSMEVYFKDLQNFLDYKDGAQLLLNNVLETDILQGEGKAYGAEFFVKKKAGKLNGWLSYTYSRTFLKLDGNFTTERVNNGEYFPANYDKPHDFTMISNYKFSRRYSFSFNATYSTGRPITYPVAKYSLGGSENIHYSDRNQYRIPNYFRMDIAMNFEGNHKVKKLAHSFFTFSIYNLTGRKNIYSIYFVAEEGEIKGYKLSIFGAPIPTISYNFKF